VYGASKKIGKRRNGNKMTFGRPKKMMRMERRWKTGRKKAGRELAGNATEGHLNKMHSWEKAREMARKF
jgi:hypothetical protein